MVPAPPRAAGSDAEASGWKRCINMEAVCLINDLKQVVKVSLFARDVLEAHVLNANFTTVPWKGHRCPPGTVAGGGGAVRGGSIVFSLTHWCAPRLSPMPGEPSSSRGSVEKPGCFPGKGQVLLLQNSLFSWLSHQALVD